MLIKETIFILIAVWICGLPHKVAKAKIPVRWKAVFSHCLAIYPLVPIYANGVIHCLAYLGSP